MREPGEAMSGAPSTPTADSSGRLRQSHALLSDLTLSRATADRSEFRRSDPKWLQDAWRSPRSRVIALSKGRFPVDVFPLPGTQLSDSVRPIWLPTEHLGADWANAMTAGAEREALFLGVAQGVPYFAARMPEQIDIASGEGVWSDLRSAGTALTATDSGLLVAAVALDNWHSHHPRCARCGGVTQIGQAGWQRICAACVAEFYPRTDPAVIMLVVDDDDRALLGRRIDWQPEWFSTLAGFVEAGESAEAAVRREVAEEAGVAVGEVTYLGSQPWPFPWSLMLGYHAHATATEVQVDGAEIVEARWFSRAELGAACDAGTLAVPPAVSIARKLIERWYGSEIPGEWSMRR